MTHPKKIIIKILAAIGCLAVIGVAYHWRHDLLTAYRDWQRGPIPPAISEQEFQQQAVVTEPSSTKTAEPAKSSTPQPATEIKKPAATVEPKPPVIKALPTSINLKIPFMVQAPFTNWDELHDAACEEAAAIMLAAYYAGETEATIAPDDAERRITAAVNWENTTFGYNLDTTAAETARMIREYFDIAGVQTVALTSLDQIKHQLTAGQPVIVPAYGKTLGNPNFRNGGPLYHMLLIKGYTATGFITNDAGTKHGADYVYDYDVLWNAIHDFNGGDVPHGAKVMITVVK